MNENPLLQPFLTPHETAPFDLVKNEHYLPALQVALAEGRNEIELLITNPEAPTFENTIVALERAGDLLNRVASVMFKFERC